MLPEFVDGDLTAEQSAWIRGHLETCTECRAARSALVEMERELAGWAGHLSGRSPSPPDAREKLAARLAGPGRRAIFWIPAAAALLAAAVALAVIVPRKPAPPATREEAPLVAIPYLPPLDPRENATIVRLNVRVGTLLSMGYKFDADPDRVVPADVLVGEDGRVHAVRVLAQTN
jgi:predicted anti-sigma-YlaC factor YlaD